MSATLYIVATPIGNLGDITTRAVEVLQSVDVIACEDTRHSRPLLTHFGVDTPLLSYHEHNEVEQSKQLIDRLQQGESIALISDAGTPLISDPGYSLVRQVSALGITIVPVPGASALIAALCASGLPTNSFYFTGFLPAKSSAREKRLHELEKNQSTLIFYESTHRILDSLKSMLHVFGENRRACVARELTKKFESFYYGNLSEIIQQLEVDKNHQKGEFVVMVHGNDTVQDAQLSENAKNIVRHLLDEMPLKQAARVSAQITGEKKNKIYQYALSIDKK